MDLGNSKENNPMEGYSNLGTTKYGMAATEKFLIPIGGGPGHMQYLMLVNRSNSRQTETRKVFKHRTEGRNKLISFTARHEVIQMGFTTASALQLLSCISSCCGPTHRTWLYSPYHLARSLDRTRTGLGIEMEANLGMR